MDYTIVRTGPVDKERMPMEKGFINGGILKRQGCMQNPVITIDVEDINKAIEKVKKAGGELVKEPMKVGDMGIAAYIKDTEGNVIGLWQHLR